MPSKYLLLTAYIFLAWKIRQPILRLILYRLRDKINKNSKVGCKISQKYDNNYKPVQLRHDDVLCLVGRCSRREIHHIWNVAVTVQKMVKTNIIPQACKKITNSTNSKRFYNLQRVKNHKIHVCYAKQITKEPQ